MIEDCRVPIENIEGEVNKGIDVMMSGLDVERAFLLANVWVLPRPVLI